MVQAFYFLPELAPKEYNNREDWWKKQGKDNGKYDMKARLPVLDFL